MKRAWLKAFAGLVEEAAGNRIVVYLNGASVFFGHHGPTGRWRDILATRPNGIVTPAERQKAHRVLNMFLYVVQ